jgi:hypothetical protein
MGASAFKKFAVAAAVAVLGGLGSGAEANDRPSFGFRAGINTGDLNMTGSSFSNRTDRIRAFRFKGSIGFHAGAQMGIPLQEIDISGEPYFLGISPGALFVARSGKNSFWYSSDGSGLTPLYINYEIDAYFLDIPVPVTFKREFGSYSIKFDIGPFATIGLFGTQKLTRNGKIVISLVDDTELTQSAFEDGLDRFDAGIFASATFELDMGLFLGFRYGSGFLDNKITSGYVYVGYSL